ncbi:MAG: cupin domain-containing protein [Pseudomonadota bacterium]
MKIETGNGSRDVAPIANSAQEWNAQMKKLSARTVPSFFHLRARLPKQGRTNQVLAASTHMNVVLKTYASGGENEIHAHSNEDHFFLVMQGGATFYGPKGEEKQVRKNDGILIPAGAFYWFQAMEEEPLVLLRIGAALDPATDVLARVDIDGNPFDGYSEKNKELPLVLEDDKWFE